MVLHNIKESFNCLTVCNNIRYSTCIHNSNDQYDHNGK